MADISMISIQTRLAAGLLISLLVAFLIMGLVISHSIRDTAEGYIKSRLEHDARSLLALMKFDIDGNLFMNLDREDMIYSQPYSGHYYEISTQEQMLHSRSLWDWSFLPLADNQAAQPVMLYQTGPQGQPLLVLVRRFEKQTKPIQIIVAEDMTAVNQSINEFQTRFTLTTLAALIGLLLWQGLVMRIGLFPLKRIEKDLISLEKGEVQALSTRVPSEISSLTTQINRLLLTMSKRLSRSRNALGDLAHALKKPLTILQHLADDQDMSASPEIRKQLKDQTWRLEQIIARVLKRARIAGQGPSGQAFSLGIDMDDLVETLGTIHPDIHIVIDRTSQTEQATSLDREDLLEVLGNLLDNACKWAHREVRLIVAQTSDSLEFTVEDDGEGVPDEQQTAIMRRGERLDESVDGHGLGLAIVSDIIDDYEGSLTMDRSTKLSGMQVRVKLPLCHR